MIQLDVTVETDGRISRTNVVPGSGSGHPAVDNLARCLVAERLSLNPARSGGRPIKTDAFLLDIRINF
jgi:outer membrane biosynthesis protein TonB